MSNSDLSNLVSLVGILRKSDSQPGINAQVHIVSPDGDEVGQHRVEARVENGKYVTNRSDRYSELEITYDSIASKTIISESGSIADIRDNEWRVPVAAPELAMFRPLDFPMWGGSEDTHEIIAVKRREESFLLEVSMLGAKGESGAISEMLIDAEFGYVQRMNWNHKTYTVVDADIHSSGSIWDL